MMKQKQIKRICAMLMAGVMVLGCLAGCGSTEQPANTSTDAVESEDTAASTDVAESTETAPAKLELDGPVTIEIMSYRQGNDTNDPRELYIFRYIEYWFAEQGYDVTLELTMPTLSEFDQQLSTRLGTGDIPDMIWKGLSASKTMTYGEDQGLLLDWTPYLNEELMPNLMAVYEKYPDARTNYTTPSGAVYYLPSILSSTYDSYLGYPANAEIWVRQSWLKEAGLEEPTTVDEALEMLRAFKNHEHADGEEVWSMAMFKGFAQNAFVWGPAGYYGTGGSWYGNTMMIKDGELYYPAYTEDYRTLVTFMNTLYEEGLIHPDYLTMDDATRKSLATNNQFGVVGGYKFPDVAIDSTDEANWGDWIMLGPLTGSDGREPVWSTTRFDVDGVWASADTEYPELLAMIVDHFYSDEGAQLYVYGPHEGLDPLNEVNGWYQDEEGTVVYKDVEAGLYKNAWICKLQSIFPINAMFDQSNLILTTDAIGGYQRETAERKVTDPITGKTRTLLDTSLSTGDYTAWYNQKSEKWANNMTEVILPAAYLDAEDTLRVTELGTVLNEFISSESVKFITGERSLDEVDDYFEELKAIGVEEYIEIYREAYKPFMEETFGK